jgi:hypothetical protein
VSVVYKIIAVVRANRMSRVMEKIISKPQNAFVKDIHILDSILIASKCLDSRIKSGVHGVLCQLDIHKAFDHINLKFLLYMLRRCDFGEKWVSWIGHCISSVQFSIWLMVLYLASSGSRGLRQGDHLSPLLFVVFMEALSKMFSELSTGVFSVGSRLLVVNISHLLFADDTLVLCEANPNHLRYFRVLLVCFEAISGMKVNLAKSVLVPVSNVVNQVELVDILGCGTSSLPLKYLRMLLEAFYKAKSIWDGIGEKMERQLANWKRMYLSKGGKVTLIKSTLYNLPTYFMSLFPILACVSNRIEKLQRNFL